MNAISTFDVKKSVYVCFHLRKERPTRACLDRLTQLGVDCVSEGPAFQVYGVVSDTRAAQSLLADDPEIVHIEQTDPPSSK
ncbi:MAG: hypothetical protein U0136_01795 [Bdellovibrionota bacterium]